MIWKRVGLMGMQSGEYRVGKFINGNRFVITRESVDDGALCTLYKLTYGEDEHIGWFADFESAKAKAEAHESAKQNVLGADGTTRKRVDR